MRAGVKSLDRREEELRTFDVNTIRDHGDPNAEALRLNYNTTIAKVFGGEDTIEHERFSIRSFDRATRYMRLDPMFGGGRGVNVAEVQQGYRKGLDEALRNIKTIRERRRLNPSRYLYSAMSANGQNRTFDAGLTERQRDS
jgi:hypothetical protein